MMDQMGRDYRIVLNDEIPDGKFAFLQGFDRIESYDTLSERGPVPRAVFVDTPTISSKRVGNVALMVGQHTRTLLIDHHAGNSEEADVMILDPDASAASEMVYRIVQASGVSITQTMATQIYAGIAFDTKLFKFSHPERGLKVCAELVDRGADPQAIADALFAHQTLETVQTLASALSTLELHMDGRVSILLVDHAAYGLGGDLDVVVDHAASIEGVDVALFLKEESPGRYRISLRSRGAFNVNQVARTFGGGGHEKASGCTIEAPLQDVKKRLLHELTQQL
jgi:phosphoesterase RecJ-like protein